VSADIAARVGEILRSLPAHVELVAAAKTRTPEEIRAALAAGVRAVGQNYVQEAERAIRALGRGCARWHMIGHLQRNKARAAVSLFDLIQTVDSPRLAEAIDREAGRAGRVIPILIEINSASETEKSGVPPGEAVELVREAAGLSSIHVEGLMTMGPFSTDPEALRPAFRLVRRIFDDVAALRIPNVEMKTLSMGMSDSVRVGTALFGPRA
jgi:pyridoxal phosphate enzyme (YggS family)